MIAATYATGLLQFDSLASWIVGLLFIDELIIVAYVAALILAILAALILAILAALILAMKDGRKIRTLWNTKR